MKRRLLQTLITTAVMSSLVVTPVLATPQDDSESLEQKKSQAEAQAETASQTETDSETASQTETDSQPETQADAFEQKKNEAQAQAEAQMDSLEQKKNQAEAQANSVNNELVGLLVDYDALQKDMETQEKRIGEAENDLKDAEAKEKQQYEDMKLRIKYMYEEGDEGLLSTLVDAKSYSELVSKAEYIQKVHDYDRKMLDKYVETKNEVAELKENLEEGQAEMQALSDEMVVQKENLETTLTQMRSQIKDFDSQLVQAKEAAAAELRRIEEEQQAAEAAEAAAREQQAAAEAAAREQQAAAEAAEQQKQDDAQSENSGSSDSQTVPNPSGTSDDNGEDSEAKPEESSGNDSKDNDKKDGQDQDNNKQSEDNDDEQNDGNEQNSDDKQDDGKKQDSTDKQDDTTSKTSNASLGQQIADMGCNYIGNKYVYGGSSLTNGIDCSGFVQQIHRKFGISTPRTSGAIRSGGKSVSYADRMPGDVICYSGHVAIYIGNNKIVHASNSAPYPKGGIKISSPANYRTILAVRRYW